MKKLYIVVFVGGIILATSYASFNIIKNDGLWDDITAQVYRSSKVGDLTLADPEITCNVSPAEISLNWTKAKGATSYSVERKYVSNSISTTSTSTMGVALPSSDWQTIVSDISGRNFIDTALNTSNGTISYRVHAINRRSESISNQIDLFMPICESPVPTMTPVSTPSVSVTPKTPGTSPTLTPKPSVSPSVTPTPTKTPTPTATTGAKFNLGDSIKIVSSGSLNVRSTANGTLIGTQPSGAFGIVIDGPVRAAKLTWWKINYTTGVDGWTAETNLIRAAETVPLPTSVNNNQNNIPTPTTVPTATIISTTPTPIKTPTPTPTVTATPKPPTTSQSTPAVSGAVQWGAYVGDNPSDLNSFESTVGKSVNIQAMFNGWGGSNGFPMSFATPLKSANKTLAIFWEPQGDGSSGTNQPSYNYDSIINGNWDSYISQFAKDAKSYGGPVLLIPYHEMNGNWDPWDGTVNGNTAAKFITAWRHTHDLFVAAGATNVKFGWAVNNDSVPDTSGNAITAYYPGDGYVDYVGVDGFNFGNPWQSFNDVFANALSKVKSYGKPVYIFSMATAEGAQKAAWITDALTVQIPSHSEIAGWIWFNENKEQNWTVNSTSIVLSAFKLAI